MTYADIPAYTRIPRHSLLLFRVHLQQHSLVTNGHKLRKSNHTVEIIAYLRVIKYFIQLHYIFSRSKELLFKPVIEEIIQDCILCTVVKTC